MEPVLEIITNLGFPVACVVALAFFGKNYLTRIMDENAAREAKYQEMLTQYGDNMAIITSTLERIEQKQSSMEDKLDNIEGRING